METAIKEFDQDRISIQKMQVKLLPPGGGAGGDSAYERGGDARREFWIKPLKETDLGEAKAFFDP